MFCLLSLASSTCLNLNAFITSCFVLGLEIKSVSDFPQQHFRNFDPIGTVITHHEGFQVASTTYIGRGPSIHSLIEVCSSPRAILLGRNDKGRTAIPIRIAECYSLHAYKYRNPNVPVRISQNLSTNQAFLLQKYPNVFFP